MSVAKAQETAQGHGCALRVTTIDGKAQTQAAIGGRRYIDVEVQHDVVVRFDHRWGPIG